MKKIVLLMLFISISAFSAEVENEKNLNLENFKHEDTYAKEAMQSWLNGDFGVKPYKPNYILPFGYRDRDYRSYTADKYRNIEAELQVSLKLPIYKDLFGLDGMYYLSYSQQAFWQIYVTSSPFRETNYNPEAFVVFPIFSDISGFELRTIKFSIAHMSNGLGNHDVMPNGDVVNRSRSINYIYTDFAFQNDTLLTDFIVMAPYLGEKDLSDNPHIMDYWGYTAVKFTYFRGKNMFTFMGRGNIGTLRGAVEATYSHPIRDTKTYLYAKLFSGYGESLIDYNNNITKISIGFAFSR